MPIPTQYDVTILVNDVDVTQYTPKESMNFEDYARQVSKFSMRIENPSGVTPTRNHSVLITANSLTGAPVIFDGFITEVTTKKYGIATHYEVECADQKIRLQKTVLNGNIYTGSDADILSSLLTNAYPDLSTLFDFSTGVNSFASGLEFPVLDGSNLLDSLNNLEDTTGGNWSVENVKQGAKHITFDAGGYSSYTFRASTGGVTSQETATGNPGDANEINFVSSPINTSGGIEIDMGGSVTVTNVALDIYYTSNPLNFVEIYFGDKNGVWPSTTTLNSIFDTGFGSTGSWYSYNFDTFGAWTFDITDQYFYFYVGPGHSSGTNTITYYVDNITIYYQSSTSSVPELQWNDTPPAADFNFDIQSGNEYASDIDYTVGDYDDYNSITVIGGYEDISTDLIFDSDGIRTHIDLPYPIDSLVVYTNGGTDTTPAWGTALALGTWGTDTLTGDGGTKDVLYAADFHWLNFDSAPPNLVKSWRITGTIKRPIRVRVENVSGSDPVLAKSYTDETITSVDQAIAAAQAQLNQKNAIKRITFKTNNPGLKPGQTINIADTARGLDETLLINRISTTWLGASGHAEFEIECGDEEETSIDTIIANADKRTQQSAITDSANTQTAVLLTDDSSVLLTDDSGGQLYYIA